MTSKTYELAQECKRQYDNCLYSAVSITLWLKFLRWVCVVLVAVSLTCGSFAGWSIVKDSNNDTVRVIAAVTAFLAGLIPTIISALKIPDQIERSQRLHGEFTNLRGRFRQAALVHSKKPFAEFEAIFNQLADRIDAARAEGVTPPELFFRVAQAKIKKGDYSFDIDIAPQSAEQE